MKFLRNNKAASGTEYGLLAGLIGAVAVTSVYGQCFCVQSGFVRMVYNRCQWNAGWLRFECDGLAIGEQACLAAFGLVI